jgi:DNA repair and recombination protein RadB
VIKKYSSGSKRLDDFIGGGFEVGSLTQIYGAGGSGKTNICLLIAINTVRRGEKVVFIDTEGLSADRFRQMAREDAEDIAKKIIVYEPTTFKEQHSAIKDLKKVVKGVGVIIVDSATALYRISLKDDKLMPIRSLGDQMTFLLGLARKNEMSVVITNQVYLDIESGEDKPIGGNILNHLSKTIIKLEKLDGGIRSATLKKHRSLPEGRSIKFKITEEGIE